MGYNYYWFPSQSGAYKTPSGDVRFCIYYDTGAADAHTDTNAKLIEISPLIIPLQVESAPDTFRFSRIDLLFENTNDIFETQPVLDENYTGQTFFTFYKDGAVFWRGSVDIKNSLKKEWRYDGSSLKYGLRKVRINDAFRYFLDNDVMLSDVGVSLGTSYELLTSILDKIIQKIGFAAGDYILDSGFSWSEAGGTYNLNNLYFSKMGDMKVIDFLKGFQLGLGLFLFNYNGKVFVSTRSRGSSVTVSASQIAALQPIKNPISIESVEVKATIKKTDILSPQYPLSFNDYTSSQTRTGSGKDAFVYDGTGFLNHVCTQGDGGQFPTDNTNVMNSAGDGYFHDDDKDFWNDGEIEIGDMCFYNSIDGTFDPDEGSLVSGIPNIGGNYPYSKIQFLSCPTAAASGKRYRLFRGTDTDGGNLRYKMVKMTALAADIYKEFFLDYKLALKFTLRGIDTFTDLYKRFYFSGVGYFKALQIWVDFTRDRITVSGKRVG